MRRSAVTIAALLALGVFALSSEVRVANAALLNSGIAPSVMWPSAIAQVERDLGATEAAVRRKAAEALFDLPRSAQLRLLPHVLGDADNDIKLLGAALACEANLSQAPDLVPWLTDGDVRLRIAAIELYELLPDQRVISDLIRALGDSEASVRGRAVRALASLGSTEGVLPILGHIDDADADVRLEVSVALGDLGDQRATLPLMSKLQDSRPEVRAGVLRALGALKDGRALPAVTLALSDSEAEVKVAALQALGALKSPQSVAAIAGFTSSAQSEPLARAALTALAQIESPQAATELVNALTSGNDDLADWAVSTISGASALVLPPLQHCLQGQPPEGIADFCIKALTQLGGDQAGALISAALKQHVGSEVLALSALGDLNYQPALAQALEDLTARDREVQFKAAELTVTLLDPSQPNGLAVDPLLHALDAAHNDPALEESLLRALGKTASPRAIHYLSSVLSGTVAPAVRLAALEAAGRVGGKELMAAVEPSLDDANGRVRMAAALSLRRMAVSESFTPLWARLTTTAAQDREAVAVALGGPLKSLLELPVMIQAAKLKDLSHLISSSRGAVRDALIESASFLPEQSLPQFFAALLTRSADSALSAKVAEALAGRPQARAMLRNLSASPDARVRANAVWALGGDGDPSEAKFLQNAVSDADPAVAANAVAALALTVPASSELGNLLCRALSDARSYVRVNALVGLRHSQLRCSAGRESALLLRDPSPAVRKVAAELLHSVTGSNPVDDGRALARCRRHEVDVDVAQACQQRLGQAPPRGDRSSEPNSAVTVFVVPAGLTAPVANAPFAFVRADGFVRCGWTDSRGAVFEPSTPAGRVSLTEPPQALERN